MWGIVNCDLESRRHSSTSRLQGNLMHQEGREMSRRSKEVILLWYICLEGVENVDKFQGEKRGRNGKVENELEWVKKF